MELKARPNIEFNFGAIGSPSFWGDLQSLVRHKWWRRSNRCLHLWHHPTYLPSQSSHLCGLNAPLRIVPTDQALSVEECRQCWCTSRSDGQLTSVPRGTGSSSSSTYNQLKLFQFVSILFNVVEFQRFATPHLVCFLFPFYILHLKLSFITTCHFFFCTLYLIFF